jgi:hypothetical protein
MERQKELHQTFNPVFVPAPEVTTVSSGTSDDSDSMSVSRSSSEDSDEMPIPDPDDSGVVQVVTGNGFQVVDVPEEPGPAAWSVSGFGFEGESDEHQVRECTRVDDGSGQEDVGGGESRACPLGSIREQDGGKWIDQDRSSGNEAVRGVFS